MTVSKPMTGEQLDELMTVAVNMQRDSEKAGDRPAAMFAYAVQVAVLELRKVRNDAAAMAAENAGLKECNTDIMKHVYRSKTYLDSSRVVDAIQGLQCAIERKSGKTPATDAFLAEVRAQGVDVAIEHLINKFEGTGSIGMPVMALEWLAQELRKGARS